MMSGIVANLLVNLIMVALLMVTISYCWMLNRRIKVLQDSKSELAQLLRYFDESTQRASDSIVSLQNTSKKIGDNIQGRLEKANDMLDDLAFMIEKGNKVANQIEAGLAVQRARTRATPTAVQTKLEEIAQEEIQAASAAPIVKRQPVIEQPAPREEKSKAAMSSSLENILERISERNKANASKKVETIAEDVAKDMPSIRSKTEMELLAMLKSGMRG
ncbi:MAG: DUF6468 domain-containing protein [Rickettsiales bacterium]|nr:DUF6468 domain-containing protein [Rickettsiales bacterium]